LKWRARSRQGSGKRSSARHFAMAVVLEEVLPKDFEPSPEEVAEYAEWLGMDLTKDFDFLWIAREGLKAPLPPAWKACESNGDIFFFNFCTGQSEWDHPSDMDCRQMYLHAKESRDAPVRVVTIHGSLDDELSTLTVRCCGSFTGEQFSTVEVKSTIKLGVCRSELANQLGVSKSKLMIMVPDGRLLAQEDNDSSSLATVLGLACQDSDHEQVDVTQDEQSSELGSPDLMKWHSPPGLQLC